ncbi:MAG: HEAT repeat domain-containing protein, partial [Leptolyngbyaceae cyanobacterium]
TLQQLQAIENPLGIVPEPPSTELETLEPDSAAAPDGQPSVASTPVDGGAEATDPLAEEATPSEAENAQGREESGGLIRFILVGMVVAAMGISAAVVLLFLLRRPAASGGSDPDAAGLEPTTADSAVTDQPQVSSPPAAAAPAQQPISSPSIAPIADAPRNGHNPVKETPPQPAAQSSALAPEPTTKLVPVNIIDELVQDLQNPDPAQRRKAIWELGQRGNSTAVQPLVRLMLDADSKERSLILAALAEINTQTLKPMNRALALSLQDENPEVRKNAIRDMTRIYDLMGQASTMLNHAATDSDPEVRQTASWAMEQLDRMRLKAINTDVSSLPGHNGSDV